MTKDDVLFGYRCQVFDLAGRTSVSHACRTFGIHRSTFYAWKAQVDRGGLEMLRPRERRAPQMPNQLSAVIEERIVAFAIAHPGLGPKRIASELAREKCGAIVVSPNGVYKALCRHGLGTRAKRLSLIAGYRAPFEPPREPEPRAAHRRRAARTAGRHRRLKAGRLKGTKGDVWQLTAIDIYSSFGWTELVVCPTGNPNDKQTSRFARRIARDLRDAGWRLERVLTDNDSTLLRARRRNTEEAPPRGPPPSSGAALSIQLGRADVISRTRDATRSSLRARKRASPSSHVRRSPRTMSTSAR